MLKFLRDSTFILTSNEFERDFSQIEVFGGMTAVSTESKIVELATNKQKDLSVIVILPSLEKCE